MHWNRNTSDNATFGPNPDPNTSGADDKKALHVTKQTRFLIVDDDRVSVLALQRAMTRLGLLNETHACTDGLDALAFLGHAPPHPQQPPPSVIFLDLNMPRMGGLAFLDAIRERRTRQHLQVFILTTQDAPEIDATYRADIAGYILKDRLTTSLQRVFIIRDAKAKGAPEDAPFVS